MSIVCISGLSGSGKSLASDMLNEMIKAEKERDVCIMSLADPLKRIIRSIYFYLSKDQTLIGDDILYGPSHVKNSYRLSEQCTLRQFLQIFGTDIMKKELGDNVWVSTLCCQVNEYLYGEDDNVVIIPDVRFSSEMSLIINMCDKEGYELYMVHITRDSVSKMSHVSETGWDDIAKVCIDNNVPVYELENNGNDKEVLRKELRKKVLNSIV